MHVGQEDIDYLASQANDGARIKSLVSLARTLAQALKAQAQGADYIGFGSVFETQTKPERQAMDLDLLQKVIKQVKIPVFPIGGISRGNIGQLIPLGVTRVAVCRDILLAKDVGRRSGRFKRAVDCKRG